MIVRGIRGGAGRLEADYAGIVDGGVVLASLVLSRLGSRPLRLLGYGLGGWAVACFVRGRRPSGTIFSLLGRVAGVDAALDEEPWQESRDAAPPYSRMEPALVGGGVPRRVPEALDSYDLSGEGDKPAPSVDGDLGTGD